MIGRSFGNNDGYYIPADTVRRTEEKNGKASKEKRATCCRCGGQLMLQNTHVAALGELDTSDHAPSHSVFGFWLYLMTDCMLFASLFAVFAVMAHQFAGGPTGKDLFDIPGVALETAVLLLSSITYGFAMLGAHKRKSGVVLAGWRDIPAGSGVSRGSKCRSFRT